MPTEEPASAPSSEPEAALAPLPRPAVPAPAPPDPRPEGLQTIGFGRGFVLLPSSTPAPMRSRRSRSASGCRRSRSRTRRRGTSAPKLEPVGWVESAGTGEVYTYSVHYIGPSKAYKGDPPHVVVLVDLDEGVRMMSNLVKDEPDYPSIDPEDVSIGMRVQVVFHDVTDEITLPKFVPA
jgi:hypothetical protein